MLKHTFLIIGLVLAGFFGHAQFPPPAGQPGSTAIPHDSSCFKFWANTCFVFRGFVMITDTNFTYLGNNRAYFGAETDALDTADEVVISLGDGGSALVTFPVTIGNGPGFDFAVFENGLGDTFLELGFVEASSDGQRFVRFPAVSYVQDTSQVATFGSTDATLINNFAGKYRALYGTPFDLDDIKDSAGIDLQRISHIRIVDVVGCIQPGFSTFDSQGNTVNEPWPTPFHSCGFDLDAIGVINLGAQGTGNTTGNNTVNIYPNPVSDYLNVSCGTSECILTVFSMGGKAMTEELAFARAGRIRMTGFPAAIYLCRIIFPDGSVVVRKVMKK